MSSNPRAFQKNKKIFYDNLISLWTSSPDYASMGDELDAILLLADRVLASCQEDLEFNRVLNIAEHLEKISMGVNTSKTAEDILEDMELWLKAILSLAKPNIWQRRHRESNYTLAPLMREDLDLLSQSEISLDLDSYHQISDPIKQLIFLAYRYRNPLTHSPRDYSDFVKARFLPASLCTLIASIYKYRTEIRRALSGLIVSPFTSSTHINMLSLINSERQKHLMNFRGREKWLYELSQKLLLPSDSPKPYTLLNGHEGMGKSALVAKLTEELSANTSVIGRNTSLVKKTAPWLPSLIVHFGKQSNQPYEIAELLLAQINTLLLEPIDMEQIRIAHKDFPQKESPAFGYLTAEPQNQYINEKSYLSPSSHEVVDTIKTETYDFTWYRRVLHLALEQVVREKGSVILVVDAVDEISLDGSSLQFLPDPLPIGVSALLSARESRVVKWLDNYRDVEIIRLKELEKNEIPLFTNVRSEDGEMQSRFNDRVWKASGGWPLMVLEASKLAQNNPTDLDHIQIDRSKDGLFERRVNEWRLTNVLIDILKLLSIFESVAPIDLDMIQAFLERNGSEFSRDEIKQHLQHVSSQIEGLDANRIKLALKAFAEYIRERWLGKKDLLRVLEDIVAWLAKKEYSNPELLAQFLNFWTSSVHSKDIRKTTEKLIDLFVESSDAKVLYEMYLGLRKFSKDTPILSDAMIHCLRASADLKNISAMLTLAGRLLDGEGLEKNINEGKELLESAALSGDANAMRILGNRLLDGKGIDQNIERGTELLVKAVETGDELAKYIYAIRLLEGNGFDQDIYRGEQLLRELTDQGYWLAAFDLANRLIDSDGIEKDQESGERILRILCEKYDSAELLLANRLIDGHGLQTNTVEGEAILRKLVNKGNKKAVFALGSRLHYGNGLRKNVDESLRLLNNLANTGDTLAMRTLGTILISGDEVSVDIETGKRWLIKAAEAEDVESMIVLSEYLLDGKELLKNAQEGKKWLYKAAETKNPKAMQILATRLINGIGISKDSKVGMKWLRKAADAQDPRAMIMLGSKLLYGDGLDKDLSKGEQLLRKVIEDDIDEDSDAMRVLGVELIDGTALEMNIEEGEELLRQAAEDGNQDAMTDLGMRLFDGNMLKQNIEEGTEWLNKAIEQNEARAKVFLGQALLKGRLIQKDACRGETLLREAISDDEEQAKRILGEYLIEDKNNKNTIEEGIKLIQEAAQEGDQDAMLKLSEMLFKGEIMSKDEKEGKRLLRKLVQLEDNAGTLELADRLLYGEGIEKNVPEAVKLITRLLEKGQGYAGSLLGRYYYEYKNLEMAAIYLKKGVDLNNENAKNNLAFMIRRGEVIGYSGIPTIKDLLLEYVEKKDLYATINYALCIAAGFQYEKDWLKADEIISSLSESSDPPKNALTWWHKILISNNGDSEGHLVLGWLLRHQLIEDPDNLTVAQRMTKAREGGWDVPDWMNTIVPK